MAADQGAGSCGPRNRGGGQRHPVIGPDGTVRLRCYLASADSVWLSAGCQGRQGCGHSAPIGIRAALRIMGSSEATVRQLERRLRCVSAPKWDPTWITAEATEITNKIALWVGSRSAPTGTPPTDESAIQISSLAKIERDPTWEPIHKPRPETQAGLPQEGAGAAPSWVLTYRADLNPRDSDQDLPCEFRLAAARASANAVGTPCCSM